jgi:hypothetical protein
VAPPHHRCMLKCALDKPCRRSDFRTRLFKQRRRGPIKAQPFDRTMPTLLREAAAQSAGGALGPTDTVGGGGGGGTDSTHEDSGILIADAPLFFRAPIPSILHPVGDARVLSLDASTGAAAPGALSCT